MRPPAPSPAPVLHIGYALRCAALASLIAWPILLGLWTVLP